MVSQKSPVVHATIFHFLIFFSVFYLFVLYCLVVYVSLFVCFSVAGGRRWHHRKDSHRAQWWRGELGVALGSCDHSEAAAKRKGRLWTQPIPRNRHFHPPDCIFCVQSVINSEKRLPEEQCALNELAGAWGSGDNKHVLSCFVLQMLMIRLCNNCFFKALCSRV